MKITPGGDLSTGSLWVDEAGTFHTRIVAASSQPTKRDGNLIDNGLFSVGLEVLAGTNETQIGRTVDLVFYYPKDSDKNHGAFAQKKIDRFLLATGLASREQLEKADSAIDVDIESTVDRQLVVKIEMEESDKTPGKFFAKLSFAEIFHVDDSAVKSIPKSAENLRLLPPEERWTGSKAAASKKYKPAARPEQTETADANKAASDGWKI